MQPEVTTNTKIVPHLAKSLAERTPVDPVVVENVLLKGDLRQLTPIQKIAYYNNVCGSLGLNPLTQPFAYIVLNGKEVLYAKREATEQLRKLHEISVAIPSREVIEGVYVVTARASMPNGRQDESTGAVTIDGLKGENRANAMLKAETKAKRRVTLSICGLGMLDETEVDSIPAGSIEGPLIPTPQPIAIPDGAVQITYSHVGKWGGRIKAVDSKGIETEYPVPDTRTAELCEAIQQEGVPAVLTLVKGVRDGKVKVKAVHRWKSPDQLANEAIDAEIAAKEQPVL